MEPGRPHTPTEIDALAVKAFTTSGLTQAQAAERLGVSQPSVAKALRGAPNLHALRVRLLSELSPYRVEGPLYVLVEKGERQ